MLAAMAKEEGKSLHRDLPEDERRSELEQCIAKVEREIDDETSRLRSLEIDIRNPAKRCKAEIDLQKCKGLETINYLNNDRNNTGSPGTGDRNFFKRNINNLKSYFFE